MYFLEDLKKDPNNKVYLDHLGKCTADELSMYKSYHISLICLTTYLFYLRYRTQEIR